MQALFQSKRFWLAVASLVTIALKDRLPISEQQIQEFVLIIAAWIVGDSLRQTVPTSQGK